MSAQAISRQSSKEKTIKKREDIHQGQKDVFPPESTSSTIDLQRMVADPRTARPPEILALQRKYGNEAVQRLLAKHNLQAKLTVGAANDAYEQEADRVAAQVVSAPAPSIQRQGEEEEEIQTKPLAATITPLIQRQPVEEDEEEPLQGKLLQRQPIEEEEEEALQGKFIPGREAFAPGTDFESRLAATRGGGSPLPRPTREFMEQRFGTDFDGVRLHTGSESAQLNCEISAQAFTRGQDVYLGEGKEDVDSSTGKQLLAHELTHVVQQNGGPASQSIQRGRRKEGAKQARKKMKQILERGTDALTRRVASGGGETAISGAANAPTVSAETMNAWNALVERNHVRQQETWSVDNCAEAHLWMKLREAGKVAKNIVVFVGQYTSKRKVRGDRPCGNCAQWVHREFKEVKGHS